MGLLHALGTCIRMKRWPSMVWIATIDLGLNVRLSLSGVGQIASPLQAAWVLSFLVSKISILRFGCAPFPPETQLIAFRSWLLMKWFFPCGHAMMLSSKTRHCVIWLLFGRITRKFLSHS